MMTNEQWEEYLDSLEGGTPFPPHAWQYDGVIRKCSTCGERETYWDDEEYPIDPCRAAVDAMMAAK